MRRSARKTEGLFPAFLIVGLPLSVAMFVVLVYFWTTILIGGLLVWALVAYLRRQPKPEQVRPAPLMTIPTALTRPVHPPYSPGYLRRWSSDRRIQERRAKAQWQADFDRVR